MSDSIFRFLCLGSLCSPDFSTLCLKKRKKIIPVMSNEVSVHNSIVLGYGFWKLHHSEWTAEQSALCIRASGTGPRHIIMMWWCYIGSLWHSWTHLQDCFVLNKWNLPVNNQTQPVLSVTVDWCSPVCLPFSCTRAVGCTEALFGLWMVLQTVKGNFEHDGFFPLSDL